jgi:hypothetical protein
VVDVEAPGKTSDFPVDVPSSDNLADLVRDDPSTMERGSTITGRRLATGNLLEISLAIAPSDTTLLPEDELSL